MGRTKSVGNGEGSIVTIRRNGKIVGYAPEISLSWEGGRRRRKRGERCATRGLARAALEELKRQHESGVDLLSKAPKVKDYFPAWLKDFARKGRDRSVETYRWAIDKVIIPQLGELTLKKVTTLRLDQWFAELLDGSPACKALAPKSVGIVRTVLLQGFKRAKKWGLVNVNPVTDTSPPPIGPSRAKVFTPDQAAALLEHARGDRLELALRLALSLGLRRGEVCGLRWEDINLEHGTLTINGTLGYIKGKGLLYGPPKTDSGRRRFQLPTSLLIALRRLLARSQAERKAMQGKWTQPDLGYVFYGTRHGGPLNPNLLYTAFRRIAALAGLVGYSPHTLRHSCASFLHAEGVPLKNISSYLGHASTTITNTVYIHLFEDALNEAVQVVERRISAAEIARHEVEV